MERNMAIDRALGCLYGQAVGNALGILTEFMNKTQVARNFPDGLKHYVNDAGEWEDDDTNQMLCVLDELVENKGVVPKSLARRFHHWLKTDGRGCGHLVFMVLKNPEYLSDPIKTAFKQWDVTGRKNAPNGALMRTSVVGLYPDNVVENTELACKVTHADPRCIGSCVIVTEIINNLVWHDRELSIDEIKAIGNLYDSRIEEWVDLAYNGTVADLRLDEPHSIGYTLRTLAAALWCYFHSPDFESGLVAIVNEGGDADTNAAVACAVLGAKYGYSGIPPYYLDNLRNRELYDAKVNSFIHPV